jgi:hypothetical protein
MSRADHACFAECVATILGVPIEWAPPEARAGDRDPFPALDRWLRENSLALRHIYVEPRQIRSECLEGPVFVGVLRADGVEPHAVACQFQGGEIVAVFDPAEPEPALGSLSPGALCEVIVIDSSEAVEPGGSPWA